MSLSRPRLLIAGLTALALLLGSGTAALAAPPATTPAPVSYVALGDSYAAGYGLSPLTGQPVPGCLQAQQNYPHQLAAALGMSLTDVTCSGATTANVIGTPQVTASGTAAPQSDALSAATDVVTLTIGGNDLGFTSIIEACAAATATGPTLASLAAGHPQPNCKATFDAGGVDLLAARIAGVVAPSLQQTLATIHTKAPNAKVFVVSYPAIAPDQATGCFTSLFDGTAFTINAFPFTDVDVPYLNGVEAQLDATIKTVAQQAGATFVPAFDQTQANTPCAGNTNSYINGITLSLTGPGTPFAIGGTTYYLTAGALHPNAAGVSFLEGQVQTAVLNEIGTVPAITSAAPPAAVVGAAYSFRVTASGFPAPTFAVTSGALPAGLSLDAATGVVSGTPTTGGTSTFAVTATNVVGHATSADYTVTAGTVPAITSAAPPAAAVGAAYSFRVTASGFPAPTFAVTSGALPAGLSLDAATGVVDGTPTTAGSFTVTVSADNGMAPAASATYTLAVAAAPASSATGGTTGTAGTLAFTGSNVLLPAGALAALLLAGGAGLVLARRRIARR